MTVDEIKSQYSMRDVVGRYGISVNRAGMCSCPFHGADKHPSMKVYKDSYHCFACCENGDMFSFIQKMDNCDFKTAFYSLGGTYEEPTFQSNIAIYRAKKAKEKREAEIEELKRQKKLVDFEISVERDVLNSLPIDSLDTAELTYELEKNLYKSDELRKEIEKR